MKLPTINHSTYIVGGLALAGIGGCALFAHRIIHNNLSNQVSLAINNLTSNPADSGHMKPSKPNSLVLDDTTAANVAHAIDASLPTTSFLPDNMPSFWSAVNPITSQLQFSQVVAKYNAIFGRDMLTYLQHMLNSTDNAAVLAWKNKLPVETFES